MERIEAKQKQLLQALAALSESILLFQSLNVKKETMIDQYHYDQVYRAFRESMIQRFEFCAELFWKYVKLYIEMVAEPVEYNSPVPVIRTAFTVGILNEQEAEQALEMIKDRNRTSHIYREEIAEELTQKIPQHHQLMNTIALRLSHKTEKQS
jgi:nucleotidyltransferase substrate binding protein (TIGR01987 family)